ncbi:MAG TPA: outer membrane beta-barrel protein, partial [Puia sp.]|nr:outer membrane beta-barrel protein [Puia sp.]
MNHVRRPLREGEAYFALVLKANHSMRKVTGLVFIFTTLSLFTYSQEKITGSVKGTLVDTAGRQNLGDASVSVLRATDSTQLAFTVTDKQGSFIVKNLDPGNYRLLISFQGYEKINRRFSILPEKNEIDFGVLYIQKQSELLQEVIVERPPITVKKDTVEYSAGMYTTKPNALAEDLLKKLPGVQVDKNGTITAQGETVTRVMVNGKRFFSDDPKLATRNLPPDIIDKIQVFDDLSDQSKFTGFDDGNRVKTINITTKKDKRQGYFGKFVAGAGSDETYDASINLHRFNGEQQISVLGQANDLNKQNFTIQDILGSSGGRRGGGGGGGQPGSGITTVWAGGMNYKDAWSPNMDAYGSYFFNNQHVSTNQQSHTQNIINKDSSTFNDGSQSNIQRTQNHRINFNLEQRFDSNNSLIFRPNITFQTTTPAGSSAILTTDDKGSSINNSISKTSSINSGYSINNANLQFRHKFAKKYRTFSIDLNTSANDNNGYGYTYAINSFYRPVKQIDTINQYYSDSLHSISFSPTLSYTEPVGKNQILEFNYNYSYNKNSSTNNTYEFEDKLKNFTRFDSLFSNSYKFTSNSNRFSLNYRIQNPNYNLSLGSGVQFTGFNSLNTTKNITVAHDYVNLTPTVNFQYTFSKTQHFRLNYSGRTGN